MSEPKRYGHKAIIYPKSDDDTYITIPVEQEDGQWVSYSDYARLKAENIRLKTEVEHLMIFCNCTIIPNKELQAQVERLTKAGDAMAIRLIRCEERFNGIESAEAQMWYIAKEGGCP